MGKEQKEVETVMMTPEELIAKQEATAKRLEEASARFEKSKAELDVRKAEEMLSGQAEAGEKPVELTAEQKIKADMDEWGMPASLRPKNLR